MRLLIAAVITAAFALSVHAADNSYPTKPIRVLVPFAPGGVVDTSARILTNKIMEKQGWQFVVDNRPGANGFIAVGTTARATADGYTLLAAHTGEFSVNPILFKAVPYDFNRDFTSIIMVSDAPMLVVVNAASPYNNLKDLIAGAKAKPGQLTFGSPGTGSVNHMATEWLVAAAGAKALHVPYKGGAPAVSAVASNEVVFTVAGLPGLFAPKGTPKEVVAKLYQASADVLKMPDVKQRYASVGGAETTTMGSVEFNKRISSELERYRKVAAQVGIEQQ